MQWYVLVFMFSTIICIICFAGTFSWKIHLLWIYSTLLQTNVEQKACHEGYRIDRPGVLQFAQMDQVIEYFTRLKFQLLFFLNRENSVDECSLDLYFAVDFEVLGQLQSHELKPGGAEIKVEDSNKDEYLRLMTDWRFSRGN